MGYEAPIVPPPKDYKGNFFKGMIYVIFYAVKKYVLE